MSKIWLACSILPKTAVLQTCYIRNICLGSTLLFRFSQNFWIFHRVKISLSILSTNIDSLFYFTSQSVGIMRMRTHSNKFLFCFKFQSIELSNCREMGNIFWDFFPFLRNIRFFFQKSFDYGSECLINQVSMIWWEY